LLVGLSYRTAPVSVRERYAVASGQQGDRVRKLVADAGLDEAVLLSTCNRTELFGSARAGDRALERMHRFLREDLGDGSALPAQIYELRDADVVRHLFHVAGGLDSMVLGEAQILGQVKQAFRAAVEAGGVGPVLARLFQHAFRTAKRIRSETGLGGSSISVARVGVSLAGEIFDDFARKRVLLVGAGEMAESALHGLRAAGADQLVVLNRTLGSAVDLAARHGGTALPLDQLSTELAHADVVITSVNVERPLLDRADFERALAGRRGRPLVVIDLGMPRNVDPGAQSLENVYLYDLDDLEGSAERGRLARASESLAAREIARVEAERYLRWLELVPHVPTIRALHERFDKLALEEAHRAAQRLPVGSDAARAELERMAAAIVAKLLHQPLEHLRREAEAGAVGYYAEALRALFGLEEEDDS
jgi:glutamyl-tRNA reductase